MQLSKCVATQNFRSASARLYSNLLGQKEGIMNRRNFIASVVAICGTTAVMRGDPLSAVSPVPPSKPDPQVKRVLAMFMCHFDAGFLNTQAAIIDLYFHDYFPRAIQIAEEMRRSGPSRYVWTTGSWLLYEYLEQATTAERKRMDQAILRGDIAWFALPFNWETELMDTSQISASIGLSKALDKRFGRVTTGAKMTDVPGHTRGLITPIVSQGVNFLDIGVNSGSMPAKVPLFFRWKDSTGTTLPMLYHHDYGTVARVPGADIAVAIIVRNDNSGPHTPAEIASIYSGLKSRYPNAEVIPTNLTEIANAVAPYSHAFPVVTEEIGDTWIYGAASDPLKVARYRELSRLRKSWIEEGTLISGGKTDLALLAYMLLEAEHTWGVDIKKWLDYDHYTPRALASVLHTKNYEVVQFSWEEKRNDLFRGIAALPSALREQAESRISALDAKEPRLYHPVRVQPGDVIDAEHFAIALDPKTGAISRLRNKKTGREWASQAHPLALFSYQTLSQEDYTTYRTKYLIRHASWTKKDFGKPNIELFGARNQDWFPSLTNIHYEQSQEGHRVLAQLTIVDPEALHSGRAAFPRKMFLELFLPRREPLVHIHFYWFEKTATRMPEALWLDFNPIVADQHGWLLHKLDERVSPFDVAVGGGRHMHALSSGFEYNSPEDKFYVETIDAPVVALGHKSPLNFSLAQPDLSTGIHCCLLNNAWGTNYVMWYGENMRFRFVLHA